MRRYGRHELLERFREADLTPVSATSFVSIALSRCCWLAGASGDPGRTTTRSPGSSCRPFNRALEASIDLERLLIRAGVRLPAGGSLLAVARRAEPGR